MTDFGRNTPANDGTDTNADGTIVVSKHVAGSSGLLGTGYLWLQALAGSGARSQKCRLVVYAADGAAGAAGTFLGATAEVLINELTPVAQWISFPAWVGAPPRIVAGTAYWIGVWWGTQVNAAIITVLRQSGFPDGQLFNTAETYSSVGAPPVVPATGTASRQYSLYFNISGGLMGWIRRRTRGRSR